jgi:hypothetical protein
MPKRIDHWIEPEPRRSERDVFSQCAFVRADTRQIPMCQSIIGILNDVEQVTLPHGLTFKRED